MSRAYDQGYVPTREGVAPPYASESTRQGKIYPSLRLSARELPPLSTWEVGKTYTLTLTLRMTEKRQHEKEPAHGEFEVRTASL